MANAFYAPNTLGLRPIYWGLSSKQEEKTQLRSGATYFHFSAEK